LRQTSTVVFCAIDALLPVRGKIQPGFEEFSVALEHAGVPVVWVTNRSRSQIDESIRKLGHRHPFIGEGGCGAYLPEGYFHLRVEKTVRLGRFTCMPIAEHQPTARDALEDLSEETGVAVVPLRSLSLHELAHNLGLPAREAELARQRDFDELFFFAGASETDVAGFQAEASRRKLLLRRRGILWSLAVGANIGRCIRELAKLYQRALRLRQSSVGVATAEDPEDLLAACDRSLLLTDQPSADDPQTRHRGRRTKEIPLSGPEVWERVVAELAAK
jgi:mannosyl-3-phosphoglycerate phosphatase